MKQFVQLLNLCFVISCFTTSLFAYSLSFNEADVSHCEVTNPNTPNLILIGQPITIQFIDNACQRRDSLVLVELYNATGGPNWTNTWDLNQPMRTWFGVGLNANGCVSKLDLDGNPDVNLIGGEGNNLNGLLPTSIWDLVDLEGLSLFSNRSLQGSISNRIGNLTKLRQLYIEGKFTGTLPAEIGNLSNLTNLIIYSGRRLTGAIPNSISNLVKLKRLDLAVNNFTSLPDLSPLKELEDLNIISNQFSGPLPAWIQNLPKLEQFRAGNNNFSGTIPEGFTKSESLEQISIDKNQLSGTIPIFDMPNLSVLDLCNNLFTDSEGLTTELWFFGIARNRLTFESILKNIEKVEGIYFYGFQEKFYEPTTFQKTKGESLTIDLGIDQTISSNVYTWFKDGQFYIQKTGDNTLTISDLSTSDDGIYLCEVTNPKLMDLTLVSHDITIEIIEENDSSTSNSPIFDTYTWLSNYITPTNCEAGSITVYQTGAYKYLLVDTGSETKMYNESGQLYCTNSANYDCVAAYNLTEVVDTWTCGSGAINNGGTDTDVNDNMDSSNDNDSSTSNSSIFDTYSWLNDFMNPANCEAASITVYQTGVYKYLLVDTGSETKLYNASGQLYCTNSANYDCVAAYNLTEVVDSFTCVETGNSGGTGADETMDEEIATTEDTEVFSSDNFPWISDVIFDEFCTQPGAQFIAEITYFQSEPYVYILIETPFDSKLYNGIGQLYCTNAPNYDCIEAFNLTPTNFKEAWDIACALFLTPSLPDLTFATRSTATEMNVYPNPTTDRIFVQLPTTSLASEEKQHIQLVDLTGRVLLTTSPTGLTTELAINNIAKGLYFVQWTTEKETQTLRLVIE